MSSRKIRKLKNIFTLSGPIVLCVALLLWGKIIASIIFPHKRPDNNKAVQREKRIVIGAIGATIIGLVHLWGPYSSLTTAIRWHSIDPTTIASLQIERLDSEDEVIGEPIIFDNIQEIQKGTALLSFAQKSPRYRSWEDGYRIRFRLSGEKEFSDISLSAYRIGYMGALKKQHAFGVIPYVGNLHEGSINNGGEYICPQFHEWLTEYIEPLFPPLVNTR